MRDREEAFGLGDNFAHLLARQMKRVKRAAVLYHVVNGNRPALDKHALLGLRESGERSNRIHFRAAHAHKQVIVGGIAPAQEFYARTLRICDSLGGELRVRDEDAAINRAFAY